MEHDYTISALTSAFENHAHQLDEQEKEHKEKYPDRISHPQEGFNLARALSVICTEIEKIKHFVGISDTLEKL